MNLTYCPEGGEHEWELWTDDFHAQMVIDCDRCHTELQRTEYVNSHTIEPLPVTVEGEVGRGHLRVKPRREV